MGLEVKAGSRYHDKLGVLVAPAGLGPLDDSLRAAPSSFTWQGPQGSQGARLGCSSDTLEKELATHSSTLAWKIPWMEKSGRLWSIGSLRVGHN